MRTRNRLIRSTCGLVVGALLINGCAQPRSHAIENRPAESEAITQQPRTTTTVESPALIEKRTAQLQQILLNSSATIALGTFIREAGVDPDSLAEVLPYILVWPAYGTQNPWPVIAHSEALSTPGAVISNPAQAVANGTSYCSTSQAIPKDIFNGFLPTPSESIRQQHESIHPPAEVATAGQWLTAIALSTHGAKVTPNSLAEALAVLQGCSNPSMVGMIQARYPSLQWRRLKSGSEIGLLLESGTLSDRWLLTLPLAETGRLHADLLGFFPSEQPEIDEWLNQAEAWGNQECAPCSIPLESLLQTTN